MIVESKETLRRYILENYNQVEILSIYLQVPINTLEHAIMHKKKINNPLRADRNPSLGIYWKRGTDGTLKCRIWDYANAKYRGDVFDVAGICTNKNPTLPSDFIFICNDIIESCTKGKRSNAYFNPRTSKIDLHNTLKAIKPFEVWTRKWTVKDKKHWSKLNLTSDDLERSYCFPVGQLAINGNITYYYSPDDPAYAYWFGKHEREDLYQIYFPLRTRDHKYSRFITNNPFLIQGIQFLSKKEILVITKSRKDVIVLKKIISDLEVSDRIEITSLTSESAILTDEMATTLIQTYDYIFTNLDFDRGGCHSAYEHRRLYGFLPLMLTNGTFASHDYKAKDISGYIAKFGYDKGVELVKEATTYIDNIINNDFYGE